MNLTTYQTNSKNELVAKTEKREQWFLLALFITLMWGIGILVISRYLFQFGTNKKSVNDQGLLIAFEGIFLVYILLLPSLLSFWYRVFDGKIKLLINENGIGYSTNLLAENNYNIYACIFKIQKSMINSDGIGYRQAFYKWNDISTYQFGTIEKKFGVKLYSLEIKPKHEYESIIIKISGLNIPYNSIQKNVELLADFNKKEDVIQGNEFTNNNTKPIVLLNTVDTNNNRLIEINQNETIIKKILIYFFMFIIGIPIVYGFLISIFKIPSFIAILLAFIFYGLFVYMIKKKKV